MSGALYVWAGGRWCELDAETGFVNGWRRPVRFVYQSRGRLQVACGKAVLRGLRALAAGQPTSVRDGAPLLQRRKKRASLAEEAPAQGAGCPHQHQHITCALNGATNNEKIPAPTTADTGVQVTLPSHSQPLSISSSHQARTNVNPPPQPNSTSSSRQARAKRKRSSSSDTHFVQQKVLVDVHRSSSEEPPGSKRHKNCTQTSNTHSRNRYIDCSEAEKTHNFKELIINEEDVDLYRSYLIQHDPHFDCYRFDTDDAYKLNVFYRINPLVNLQRSAQIERMLRCSQEMSLKDFATKLGLRSISEQGSDKRYKMRRRMERDISLFTSDEETDKENQVVRVRRNAFNQHVKESKVIPENDTKNSNQATISMKNNILPNTKKQTLIQPLKKRLNPDEALIRDSARRTEDKPAAGVSGATERDKELSQRPAVKAASVLVAKKFSNKPASLPVRSNKLNVYTSLEDHAIVSWVSSGSRARQVNGNRLWRDLQTHYHRLTGRTRTWHSLRNRYLRYILPALGALALPPHHAARLRADAAAGELKKARAERRNSIFSYPAVRSAFAARPAARQRDSDDISDASPDRQTRTRELLRDKSNKNIDKSKETKRSPNKITKHTEKLRSRRQQQTTRDPSDDESTKAEKQQKPDSQDSIYEFREESVEKRKLLREKSDNEQQSKLRNRSLISSDKKNLTRTNRSYDKTLRVISEQLKSPDSSPVRRNLSLNRSQERSKSLREKVKNSERLQSVNSSPGRRNLSLNRSGDRRNALQEKSKNSEQQKSRNQSPETSSNRRNQSQTRSKDRGDTLRERIKNSELLKLLDKSLRSSPTKRNHSKNSLQKKSEKKTSRDQSPDTSTNRRNQSHNRSNERSKTKQKSSHQLKSREQSKDSRDFKTNNQKFQISDDDTSESDAPLKSEAKINQNRHSLRRRRSRDRSANRRKSLRHRKNVTKTDQLHDQSTDDSDRSGDRFVNKRKSLRNRREKSRDESTDVSQSDSSTDRRKSSRGQVNKRDSSSQTDSDSSVNQSRKSLRDKKRNLKRKPYNQLDESTDRSQSDRSTDRRKSLRDRRVQQLKSANRSGDKSTDRSSPTYDQLTRQFSSRLRSTPNLSSDKSAVKSQPHRMRKLFNPNAPNAILRRLQ